MLTPGEIEIGMDVTVLEAEPFPIEQYKDGEGKITGQKMSMVYEALKGMPAKVVAINFPYVIVHIAKMPYVLDIRKVTFMEITPEYVQALVIEQEKNASKEFVDVLKDALESRK